MPNLGLGLNLNQRTQKQLQQAVNTPGGMGALMGQRPGLAHKIGRLENRGPSTQLDRWNAMNTAAGNAPGPRPGTGAQPTPAAPTGNAATGSGKNAAPTPPPTSPPATPPPPDSSYQGALNNQYGAGQPFGMQDWYGGNPLETARDLANRNLAKNLAGIQARYAGSGGGTSGREAIAEGTAAGEAATGLGDVMAQRGLQARQADVTAGLNAMLGAGQQQLQGQQNQMNYATGMGGLGNILNQVGAMEQGVPNAGMIEQLLGLFSQSTGQSKTRQKQQTQSGFLGM